MTNRTNELMADVMTEEEAPNTTFLKWVVIILAILIVGVASMIGVMMYKKATKVLPPKETSLTPAPEGQMMPAQVKAFGDITINAPEGMKFIRVSNDGSRMFVYYGPTLNDPRIIIVIHTGTGEILGRILLQE